MEQREVAISFQKRLFVILVAMASNVSAFVSPTNEDANQFQTTANNSSPISHIKKSQKHNPKTNKYNLPTGQPFSFKNFHLEAKLFLYSLFLFCDCLQNSSVSSSSLGRHLSFFSFPAIFSLRPLYISCCSCCLCSSNRPTEHSLSQKNIQYHRWAGVL